MTFIFTLFFRAAIEFGDVQRKATKTRVVVCRSQDLTLFADLPGPRGGFFLGMMGLTDEIVVSWTCETEERWYY